MATSSQPEAPCDGSATAAKGLGNGGSGQAQPTSDARWKYEAGVAELSEPAGFIRQLAIQNQLLACLKWLIDFQVLACIPLDSSGDGSGDDSAGDSISSSMSISAEEIADLAGVPEVQLVRVVRMTATAGFLREPRPGYVAHTALSAPFVTNLGLLDAAAFQTETAAPAALQMCAATPQQRQEEGEHKHHSYQYQPSAYSIAASAARAPQAPQTFQSACTEREKLRRQWSAYRHFVLGAGDWDGDDVVRLLSRLNWNSLGRACIVDIAGVILFEHFTSPHLDQPKADPFSLRPPSQAAAHSTDTATALASMYPLLRFVVQMAEGGDGRDCATSVAGHDEILEGLRGRVAVQRRAPEAAQPVPDAVVYILRLTSTTTTPPMPPGPFSPAQVLAELNAHVGVLRANSAATLILTVPLLPEPGAVRPDVEVRARLGNLCCLQLTGQYGMELTELLCLVGRAGDGSGRLLVASKLRCPHSDMVALGIKYQQGV